MGGQNRVLAILLGVLALLVLVVGGLSAGLLLTGRGEQATSSSGTSVRRPRAHGPGASSPGPAPGLPP